MVVHVACETEQCACVEQAGIVMPVGHTAASQLEDTQDQPPSSLIHRNDSRRVVHMRRHRQLGHTVTENGVLPAQHEDTFVPCLYSLG